MSETKSRRKVMAVASAGGHWSQLTLLSQAFSHCDIRYITTKTNRSALNCNSNITVVMDADLSTKWKLLPLAIQTGFAVLRYRPHVVVSTGAAPGFFAVAAGKLVGAKTIWIDSMANSSSLSVSGHHAKKFCDLCLTQWPDLADKSKVRYLGSLL